MAYWIFVAVSVLAAIHALTYLGWIQAMGWIYSVAFAISAIPEAISCIRNGRVRMTDGTLTCWVVGEISGLAYGIGLMQLPIIFNCAVNAIFVGIIVWYRMFPRKEE
jgi:uncharacterized protein with PQ loop repeat